MKDRKNSSQELESTFPFKSAAPPPGGGPVSGASARVNLRQRVLAPGLHVIGKDLRSRTEARNTFRTQLGSS